MHKQYQNRTLKHAQFKPKFTILNSHTHRHTHRCFHIWLQGFSLTKVTPERGFHLSNPIKYTGLDKENNSVTSQTTATNNALCTHMPQINYNSIITLSTCCNHRKINLKSRSSCHVPFNFIWVAVYFMLLAIGAALPPPRDCKRKRFNTQKGDLLFSS